MGNPLDSSQFRKFLDKRLYEVSEESKKLNELSAMVPKLYRQITSKKAWEEFMGMGTVPDLPEFNGKLTSLPISPGYHTKIEPKQYAGMIVSNRTVIEDEQYGVLEDFSGGLMDAAYRTREKSGVKTFANATSTAFDFMESEEGVSLASNSHTTRHPGVSTTTGFDNLGTSAISKTAVAATRILMRKYKNSIGERFAMSDNFALIVPDDLADSAEEINMTPKSLDTAEGNVNPQYQRYKIIPYMRLSDYTTTSWGMVNLDLMKKDLIWIERNKPETKRTWDFTTFAYMQSCYTRYACGFKDWRWLFWNSV